MTAKEIMCCNCDDPAERYVTDQGGYFCRCCAPHTYPLCCDVCFKEIDNCVHRFYEHNNKMFCRHCMAKEELK